MNWKSRLYSLLGGVSVLATMSMTSNAVAQTAAAAPAASTSDDVIVTGQRRSTAVNNTPMTIDVLTAARLDASGVNNSITLQNTIPGLQISRETALQSQVFLRGIGNNITGLSASNSVATYVDGVYIGNNVQSFQRFSDVERIEVLKGPQAVLYGRNATGGALLVVSKAPSFTPEFNGDASYGNFNSYAIRASVSGPIIGDVLAGRLSIQHDGRDGYFTNLTTGKTVDDEQNYGIRGALFYEPSHDLQVTLRADLSHIKTGDYLKITNADSWEFTLQPSAYSPDPWSQAEDVQAHSGATDGGALVNVSWNTGIGTLTSVSSYRAFETDPTFSDLDSFHGTAFFAGQPFLSMQALLGDVISTQSFWHETTFATDASQPLSLIVGANYSHEDGGWLSSRQASPTSFTAARRNSFVEASSVFADLTYQLTPRVSLGAGLRYSKEDRYYDNQNLNFTTRAPIAARTSNQTSYDSLKPRFGVEFRRIPGELWFFNYQTGFKSGGFNETNPADSFDPEEVQSYEFGLKKSWADGRLQTNISVFDYNYTDLQVQRIVFPAVTRQIDNSKSALIQGIDLDIHGHVTDELQLGASLEYLHTAYGDLFLCYDFAGPCVLNGVANPATNRNANGNQLARAPEFSAVFQGDWAHELSNNAGEISLHLDTKYTSRTQFGPFEVPIQSRDPFWVLNGEARYAPNPHYFVALFGQNLTDTLYEQHIVNTGPQFTATGVLVGNAPHYIRWAPPRTYGVRVGFSF